MSYIGRQNLGGAYRQLDDISSGFDGSDTTHTMQVNSQNVTVGDVNQIILSLGGVIQKPGTDFTVSGSTLTFTTAPAANTSFFAILLGSDNGGTVTPTDLSVSTGKIAADAVTSAKIADDAVTGDHIASSGAFAIGAANTASSIAGVTFYVGQSGSIYTADVSGTDNDAENNTAFGTAAMDAITTGDNNVAMGEAALGALTTGADNVAIGYNAGSAGTSASYNTMVGRNAGAATTANSAITAIGYYAGAANTSATQNTFLGFNAGAGCTDGGYNTAIGHNALRQPDSETNNVAIGRLAMEGSIAGAEYNVGVGNNVLDALTSGDNNVAVGYNALTAVGSGYDNVAVGFEALVAHTDGQGMTCVGYRAGQTNQTGGSNICIGRGSDVSGSNNSNSIALGINIGAASNQFRFGKSGAHVSNSFDSNANFSQASDERKKKNIRDQKLGLDFINELRTVSYNWKPSNEFPKEWDSYSETNEQNLDVTMHGMIAQEVKAAIDKYADETDKNFNGWSEDTDGMQNLSREMFVIPLIKAVQELAAKVKALEEA